MEHARSGTRHSRSGEKAGGRGLRQQHVSMPPLPAAGLQQPLPPLLAGLAAVSAMSSSGAAPWRAAAQPACPRGSGSDQ